MSRRTRAAEAWDRLRSSFGFLSAIAILAGIVLAIALPVLDRDLGIEIPALSFDGRDSVRGVLTAIATATVSVAGLSFSVTVVAFTLAAQQLSPRVLRSFRSDRLSQATLAALLGTFVYSLVLLVRLGISSEAADPPNLSVTVAVLAAVLAFGLFTLFVAHIVEMLQPSSVIAAIHADAEGVMDPGDESDRRRRGGAAVAALVESTRDRIGRSLPVDCRSHGYVTAVAAESIAAAADGADVLVEQTAEVGTWVLPGERIATIHASASADSEDCEAVADAVRRCFRLGRQRTMVQDIAFPVHQLADIALRALSPGINDPTTAQNAMEELATILVDVARDRPPADVVFGAGDEPRLVLRRPGVAELVREGFDPVRRGCGRHPQLSMRLLELLGHLLTVAGEDADAVAEIERQRRLLVAGIGADGPTPEEIAAYRSAAAAL